MSLAPKSLAMALAVTSSFALAAPRPDRTVERAVTGTQTGTVDVKFNASHGEYFGDITIDGQPYHVLFDTGSTDLWIKSNKRGSGEPFTEDYVSGSVSGTIESGTVTVGGITVENQAYGLVYGDKGSDGSYDGLIGLGASDTQFKGLKPTWLKNAIPMLKEPIFVVDIAPNAPSTFAFGFDPQACTDSDDNNINHVGPLNVSSKDPGWSIEANLKGLDDAIPCDLDTGTTDLELPNDAYNAYCSDANGHDSNLGAFEITSGNHNLTVPGILASECGKRIHSSSYCILGQPFLQGFRLVYDYGNKQVSLRSKA